MLLFIYSEPLIKKLTVLGLLCLFVWNVALSGVPSVLVCLHQDFMLYFQSEAEVEGHCESTHCHDGDSAEAEGTCELDDDCTDLELSGAELIPTRLNESEAVQLPALACVLLSLKTKAPRLCLQPAMTQSRSRAPPSIYWLTDLYIPKTVLRV